MFISDAVHGFLLDAQVNYSPATVPMIRSYLGLFTRYFEDCELSRVGGAELKRYFVYLHTEYVPNRMNKSTAPLSGSAIDNHWKILRSFFKWCELILGNPRPDLDLPRPRFIDPEIHPFTEDDCRRMLASCKFSNEINKPGKKSYRLKLSNADRDTAVILILLDTGLRLGEFCRLRVGDVNLETGEIYVRPFQTSRKSRPRTVFISPSTRRSIWKYIAKLQSKPRSDDRLFVQAPTGIEKSLKRIGEKASVNDVHPHRFRHTFAITYLRNGGDVFTLQRLLGHSTLKMVQRYLALSKTDDEAAHRRASPVDNWRL